MAYKIAFNDYAKKQLKKLPKDAQKNILDYLDSKIAILPNPKLRGEGLKANLTGLWRYRIGDYRVVCKIEEDHMLILVVKVGHRRDVYE